MVYWFFSYFNWAANYKPPSLRELRMTEVKITEAAYGSTLTPVPSVGAVIVVPVVSHTPSSALDALLPSSPTRISPSVTPTGTSWLDDYIKTPRATLTLIPTITASATITVTPRPTWTYTPAPVREVIITRIVDVAAPPIVVTQIVNNPVQVVITQPVIIYEDRVIVVTPTFTPTPTPTLTSTVTPSPTLTETLTPTFELTLEPTLIEITETVTP